jgi:hypothetical protein
MKSLLIPLLVALITLSIGIVCLFCPERIQQFGLDYYDTYKTAAKFNLFLGWMKTRSSVMVLRLMGSLAIVVSVLALFVVIRAVYK